MPSEVGAALGAYRQWAFERWGIRQSRTGIEALGTEDVASHRDQWRADSAEHWINVNGPADDQFSDWLDQPGTVVRS
jgi:hypothetical protein